MTPRLLDPLNRRKRHTATPTRDWFPLSLFLVLVAGIAATPAFGQPAKEPDPKNKNEFVVTLNGHKDRVFSVPFSPDGKRVASASTDKTVKVWDAATGQELLTLTGHTLNVYTVAFSPDGKRLASAAGGKGNEADDKKPGELKVWDAATGKELLTLQGHTGSVYSVAFSPDGKRLASGSGDQTVKLWDADTGKELLTLSGHAANVYTVVFSPDGKRLASASGDFYDNNKRSEVKLWDAATGKEHLTLKGHTGPVYHVAFTADGKRLASAGHDNLVKIWDALTGQEALTLRGHTGHVFGVAFSPDGKRLASASYDKTVRVWDLITGQEALALFGHTDWVHHVSYRPDGLRLVSGSTDKTVRLWDATGPRDAERLRLAHPTAKELEALWTDLSGMDARKAYRALWILAEAPKQTLPFLKERLKPAAMGDAERISKLIAELDSDDFKVRENATETLAKLGKLAEPALRKAIQNPPSLEVKRRAEELLEKLTGQALLPEYLVGLRAVEVLEYIGAPEAKQVLEKLATGAPEARLTLEAKASLERLAKRSAAP